MIAYSNLPRFVSRWVCSFVFEESGYVIPNIPPLCDDGTSPSVDAEGECGTFFSLV